MKKNKIVIAIIGLLMTLSAEEGGVLDKADSTMLFNENNNSNNVVELKIDEMKETEGKYWDTYQYNYVSSNYTNIIYSLSIGDTVAINSINITNVIAPTVIVAPNLTYNIYNGGN